MTGRALGKAEGKAEYAPVLVPHYFRENIDALIPEQLEHLEEQTGEFEGLALSGMPIIHDALEGILMSVVVQAWSAFETLLKQLLEKSVEKHPQCFPHLTGSEPRQFMKRELFQRTYQLYFPDASRIADLLKNESVDALCVLRNLVAHNSGYVDKIFREDSEAISCVAWAALPKGKRFEFSGDIIWNLVDRNVQNAYRLQAAVNDWLTAHEPPP